MVEATHIPSLWSKNDSKQRFPILSFLFQFVLHDMDSVGHIFCWIIDDFGTLDKSNLHTLSESTNHIGIPQVFMNYTTTIWHRYHKWWYGKCISDFKYGNFGVSNVKFQGIILPNLYGVCFIGPLEGSTQRAHGSPEGRRPRPAGMQGVKWRYRRYLWIFPYPTWIYGTARFTYMNDWFLWEM